MTYKENTMHITREQIQAMVTRGAGYAELKAALGPDSWVCVLAGQIKARAHDLPRALEGGDYHTVNHGKLATIEESTLAVGDTVLIQGKPFEVWANASTRGDAHMPSHTWFVAVAK
jgi:hypothetical protein